MDEQLPSKPELVVAEYLVSADKDYGKVWWAFAFNKTRTWIQIQSLAILIKHLFTVSEIRNLRIKSDRAIDLSEFWGQDKCIEHSL